MTEVEKDTQRPAYQSPVLSGPARFLIMAAAFVIVIAGMRAAVEIIIPFLLAIFLAIIGTPALFWLKGRGISTIFAILIVSLTIMLAGLMIGTILATSIADFTTDLPRYTTELNANVQRLEERWETWLDEQRERFALDDKDKVVLDNGDIQPAPAAQPDSPVSQAPPAMVDTETEVKEPFSLTQIVNAQAGIKLIQNLLTQMGNILTKGFLIYLTTIFILLEASILPGAISFGTGVLITIWLVLLDVKYPVVWGLTAFLLNFVPNIGSIIAAVPPCILAFLQPELGLGTLALTALGYLLVNVVIGNFIEPRLMGQRLGLSTLVVFLSLVFWGWVLGPVGMLLSVPLTMAVKIALQSHPDTRKLAILLDSQKPPVNKKKC
ncbi:MAG: AI-2E family transporter [Planctomycetota bacterium]|jgi:predicted PurR-regulated permease PerM